MSPAGETLPSELAGQLSLGIELLEKLRELLVRETAILAAGGHEPLIGIAADKQHLVVRLIDLSQVLFDFLIRAGYSPDSEGLARYIQDTPAGNACAGLYDTAMTVLRVCAVHNQTNGSLLERRRAAVNRALRILFAQPDGDSRYYSSGRLEGLNPNRLIGEA